MKIRILTLFTEIFELYLKQNILKRADIDFEFINIRDYAFNKHRQVDDIPYGGGAGMLLKPEPFWEYFKKLKKEKIKKPYCVFLSPQGNKLTQKKLIELSQKEDICLISGRYEGLDQRVIDKFVDEEISIGDYVLTSGDLPALVLIDGIIRMKDGIIKKESYETDSYYNGLLGYSQYTRPSNIDNMKVPEVLINGHHKKIEEFRLKDSIFKTMKNRIDLLNDKLNDEDFKRMYIEILNKYLKNEE